MIFAPKGGGKSAIYSMLMSRENEFFDRGILLATAENPKRRHRLRRGREGAAYLRGRVHRALEDLLPADHRADAGDYELKSDPAEKLLSEARGGGAAAAKPEAAAPPTGAQGDGLREVLLPAAWPRSRRR